MKDFFISYTSNDVDRATWIAELLEKNNYSVVIQEWDFKVGDNFISKINESLITCKKLIIILSKDYLNSKWCNAEWTSKMSEQIHTEENRIIPIRIEKVDIKGLLSPIVYIDIVDRTEDEAVELILNGLRSERKRKSRKGFQSYYNIEYLQIDNDYYVSKSEIIFIKTCICKALVDGIEKIHNRVTWFIDENISINSLIDGIDIEKIDLRDTNTNFNILMNKTYNKGDIFSYKTKITLSNNNSHFENFFSTEIITPIQNLDIHLNINDKNVKKYYTQKISHSPMNIRTELPVENTFYSPVHWHISNPEVNFEYKIFWE